MNSPRPLKSHQYSISGHARCRMVQRGVPPWVVDMLLEGGIREDMPERGCVRVFFPADAQAQPSLRGYADVELILDPVKPHVVTVQRFIDEEFTRKGKPDRRYRADRAEMSEQLRIYTGETGPGVASPDRSAARAAESHADVASVVTRGEGPSRMTALSGAGGSHDAGSPTSGVSSDSPAYHAPADRVPLEELDAKLEPIEGFMLNVWLIEWAFAAGIVLVGLVVGWALTTLG